MSSKVVYQGLRDLIRLVRSCKTAAEERAVIQKECAIIRQQFKEKTGRGKNMLKLIYITMLGYATEFGQMECVQVLAQGDFADKRIGYLALTVMLDETQEVLTLAENHIKKDLSSNNPLVQSLALNTVSNIAGEDMARDVIQEVLTLLDSSNLLLKKKACIAGLRIVQKIPSFAEVMLGKLSNPFSERNHGALLCSLALINECLVCPEGEAFLPNFRANVAGAVRTLKNLVLSSYAIEHDVQGIADPFLQVKILQFLRICGTGNAQASEAMNDILAQVATNTDGTRNVGNAVLYECVKAIVTVEADHGLLVLGINLLGRFLANRDNNIRYVALSSLQLVLGKDNAAVQRHRVTILECLQDPDISIRRRALELTVALIDESNVRLLVPDLINYANACAEELRAETAEHICRVVTRCSPSVDWRLETTIRVFKVAKQHVPRCFGEDFIAMISNQGAPLQTQTARALWEEISGTFDASLKARETLIMVASWCLGEYCDLLVASEGSSDQLPDSIASVLATIVSECDSIVVKQYALCAMTKLCVRFPSTANIVLAVLEMVAGSLDCDLQQRACESMALLQTFPDLARIAYDRMPPIETEQSELAAVPQQPVGVASTQAVNALPSAPAPGVVSAAPAKQKDIFDDIFAMDDAPAARPAPAAPPTPQPVVPPQQDIFAPAPAPAPVAPAAPSVRQWLVPGTENPEFKVDFVIVQAPNSARCYNVQAVIQNNAPVAMNDIAFLVAVPNTSVVRVEPLASNSLAPRQKLAQLFSLDNTNSPNPQNFAVRVKLVYTSNGAEKSQLFQSQQLLQ